jgi:serine protease Do
MSTRKSAVFYGLLIAMVSLVIGMVIASRLDLTPASSAADLTVPATNSAPLDGPIDATTFRNIAHEAGPSVVSIITTVNRSSVPQDLEDLFGFQLPFGNPRNPEGPQAPTPARGAGSGFIIDKEGYILTNNHVVEDATSIEVRLSTMGDRDYGLPAKVIGRDELTDTALLQLTEMPSDPLVVSRFGDSAQMAPGDWVMAIGNPFNLSNTVTVGVVSAVGRQTAVARGRYEDFIQTDAAINQGNSGGPLLNIRGEVIGINTMIITSQGMGNVGVGFAVPINTVRDLLPQLRTGKVVRGRIGVQVLRDRITPEYAKELGLPSAAGAEISMVERNSPADRAGVEVGDVIIEFNGKPVRDNGELVSLVASTRPGSTVPMKVVRDRKTVTLNVTVGELNLAEEQSAQNLGEDAPTAEQPQETDLGMRIRPLTQRERTQLRVPTGRGGAVVTDVTPFGPAQQAGLGRGDVIMSVMGQDVSSVDEATAALDRIQNGRTARIIVWRFTPGRGQSPGEGQEVLVQIRKR